MTTIIATAKHIRRHFQQYLLFEALVALITSAIILPQFFRLYQWALHRSGISFALNAQVLHPPLFSSRFLVSAGGVALAMLLVLFEFLVLIVLIERNTAGRPMTIARAIRLSVRNLRRLLLPGLFFILSMAVLFVPMLLNASGFRPVNIPVTLYEFALDLRRMNALWFVAVALWLYLNVHTTYILYCMLVYNARFSVAVRRSFEKIRGKFFRVLINWTLIIAVMAALWLFLSLSVQNTANWVSRLALYAPLKRAIIYALSISIYTLVLTCLPFLVTYMSFMFRELLGAEEEVASATWLTEDTPAKPRRHSSRSRAERERRSRVVAAIATLSVLSVLGLNFAIVENLTTGNIMVVAHRGDSSAEQENSLEAILSAIEKQADCVELDVMATKDGVLILHHDVTLRRLTGDDRLVADVTHAEVQALSARIPTLEEALDLCKGKTFVILDLKASGDVDVVVPQVVEMIEAREMRQEVYIQSFNSAALSRVRELAPDMRIGQIMYLATGDLSGLDVDFYTIKSNMLTSAFVRRARALDRGIWVWTVNTVGDLREVMRHDIDGVITDYPGVAQLVRSGL